MYLVKLEILLLHQKSARSLERYFLLAVKYIGIKYKYIFFIFYHDLLVRVSMVVGNNDGHFNKKKFNVLFFILFFLQINSFINYELFVKSL